VHDVEVQAVADDDLLREDLPDVPITVVLNWWAELAKAAELSQAFPSSQVCRTEGYPASGERKFCRFVGRYAKARAAD
jgi:hypothetical protein